MKISVIIATLNARHTLEESMASVWRQSHKDYEIVVMDGGSRDGTVELLKAHNDKIAYWVSAKDKGTTDAINRGYAKTTGDLVTFLSADDAFADEHVFERVVREIEAFPETQIICSSLLMVDPKGVVLPYINRSNPDLMHRRGTLNILGAFFKKDIMRNPPLSDQVEICNDYELFAYLMQQAKAKLRVIDMVTVHFSLGGRTNDKRNDFWKAKECFYIHKTYYGWRSAWTMLAVDFSVGTLRLLGIRPLTWMRRGRQLLELFGNTKRERTHLN